jgi:hypothetical protein
VYHLFGQAQYRGRGTDCLFSSVLNTNRPGRSCRIPLESEVSGSDQTNWYVWTLRLGLQAIPLRRGMVFDCRMPKKQNLV